MFAISLAMTALQLVPGGGCIRIQQPLDVIELFSTDPLCLWQFRQLEDGPLSLMMAVLVTL